MRPFEAPSPPKHARRQSTLTQSTAVQHMRVLRALPLVAGVCARHSTRHATECTGAATTRQRHITSATVHSDLVAHDRHDSASISHSRPIGATAAICLPDAAAPRPHSTLQPLSHPFSTSVADTSTTGTQGATTLDRQPQTKHAYPPSTQLGRVELIVGPMFSGKTSHLIHRAREAQGAGRAVLVVKSAKDTRYGSHNQLRSHDGLLLPCHPVHALRDVSAASVEAAELIAIDEAQFFPDLAEFVTRAADRLHKHVLVAGLDGDFRRQNWEQISQLYPMADHVVKLRSKCHVPNCTHPAIFSKRLTAHTEQELVGGADVYVAACRRHYVQAKADASP